MNGNAIAHILSIGFEECRLRTPRKRSFKSHDAIQDRLSPIDISLLCTDAALVMAR